MKKKNFKRFTIFLISILALTSTAIVFGCAVFDEEDMYYSFFAPETSHADAYTPFYRSFRMLYTEENPVADFYEKNIEEWTDFFKNKVQRSDLDTLLYKSKIEDIDLLVGCITDKTHPCPEQFKNNSILKIKNKGATLNFLKYLKYAKKCEPYATYVNDSWDDKDNELDLKKHRETAQGLIAEGTTAMASDQPTFIMQRYAFQIERLYFLSNQWETSLKFYQEHVRLFADKHSIQYRAMGYAAGSLYKLKRYAEANYLYALIYDQCEPMRVSAYLSFHPLEENDWQACLNRSKNNREKMVAWQLMGIYADPLRAMKEIYKIDPSSELMDVLLARAVNIEEENFLPIRNSYEVDVDTIYSFKTTKIDKELVGFIEDVAEKGNAHKPYLWNLTAGYFAIVEGAYKSADGYLAKVKKKMNDDTLVIDQMRAFEIISNVEQEKKFDAAFESKMVAEMKWLNSYPHKNAFRSESLYTWLLNRLSEKYKAIGEVVKAQCLNAASDRLFYEHTGYAQKMLTYMDKPDKTTFDYYILGEYQFKKTDIFESQGSQLLYQYKFKEAISKFEQCPGAGETTLLADPFVIHINDCHDCDFSDTGQKKYSKITFAKKMLALENKLKADPKNALAAFDLANGYYNMTYFGNARLLYQCAIKTYVDDIDWSFEQTENYNYYGYYSIPRTSVILNCERAEAYYKKAMDLSTSMEFKAKCCFMAAKAEQNEMYVADPEKPENDSQQDRYFKILKSSFSTTKYYTEIIKECGYFKDFVNK